MSQIQSPAPEPAPSVDELVQSRITKVINLIRPAVQADGGDVEFVELTPEGVVKIRLHGACVGCPSSAVTLQMGIERNLRQHIPQVKAVHAVNEG
ncbi:MAG: NifU family protein [Planctomycetota bacterium]|nr:NifU family protein [Planctomycetota bacterium]